MRERALLATAALAVLVAGCGSASDGGGTTDPPLAPGPSVPACEQTAAKSEEIHVANEWGTVSGTLSTPDHCGAIPVVLIVGASDGTGTDRDGNIPGTTQQSSVYKELASALGSRGFATLRYDWPGIAKSASARPAKAEDFLFADEVAVTVQWIASLRADMRFSRVIAAGHSSGALTATLAAEKSPIDALVCLEGAGRPAGQLLIEQMAPHLTLAQNQALASAVAELEKGQMPGALAPPLDQMFPVAMQPYYASWFALDPAAELHALTIPALVVRGRTDVQVFEKDAHLLQQARPDATVLFVDGMNHMLKTAGDDSASQDRAYTDPTVPLAPGLLDPLVAFVGTAP